MDQAQVQQIKLRTTKNLVFLSIRNLGIRAISTLGFFVLTILLGTAEVGLFAIVSESVGILGYFSDIGLAAALIQQRRPITKKQLKTTFFIQQTLVFLAILVLLIIYPRIQQSKGYGTTEFLIFISLVYSFITASLKTIPSVLLERRLNFKLISSIDVAENVTFYSTAVILALLGFGARSYAFATFLRSSLGLILIYWKNPWPIGFAFDFKTTKKLFRFGIPFQFNSFLALAKDRLSNLLVAGIIGRQPFGILSWAQKGPLVPLSLMDAVMRVTFPTFSRLQSQKKLLKSSITKSTFFISLLVFPALAGIALIAPDFIKIIPKYSKWAPAIIPLYFYASSYAFAAVTTPLTNAFNAVGKISLTSRFMAMWTVLTWIFYPLLTIKFGFRGTALAALIVSSSSVLVWQTSQRLFKVSVLNTIKKPLVSTGIMIAAVLLLARHPNPALNLTISVIVGLLSYSLFHFFFSRQELVWFIDQIKCLRNKK